jgi:crossover junction endodeoxyribonuclease RuvC
MTILGIDPGFADMGYGVINTDGSGRDRVVVYGSVKTPAGERIEDRLAAIYDALAALIVQHRPDRAGVEKLFFSTNAKSAMLVAEARGVIRVCLKKHGVPAVEVSPAEVKIAVSGNGAAAKPDVQKMTKVLLGLTEIPKPDDAADALAIAIAVAHTRVPAR